MFVSKPFLTCRNYSQNVTVLSLALTIIKASINKILNKELNIRFVDYKRKGAVVVVIVW